MIKKYNTVLFCTGFWKAMREKLDFLNAEDDSSGVINIFLFSRFPTNGTHTPSPAPVIFNYRYLEGVPPWNISPRVSFWNHTPI